MILGPVAKGAAGFKINSMGDLLAKLEFLNSNDTESKPTSGQGLSHDRCTCDFCNKCDGKPLSEAEKKDEKAVIDRITSKKVKMTKHMSNNLKSKLRAFGIAKKLYHRGCVPIDPVTGIDQSEENPNEADQDLTNQDAKFRPQQGN